MDLVALTKALVNSPAGNFLTAFSPTARLLLDYVREHEDLIARAIPVIQAAAKEGPAAIDAVEKNAPELVAAVKTMLNASVNARSHFVSVQLDPALDRVKDVQVENVLRSMAGLPKMSFEAELAWMNRTAGSDPSRENSRAGGA
jgi:hypothetical protein